MTFPPVQTCVELYYVNCLELCLNNIETSVQYHPCSFEFFYLNATYKLCWYIFFRMDEGRQPLSRKLPVPSSKISPYRLIIILRLVILGLFFHYRILHPVNDAYGLWLTSVICEIWFGVSWILDQFPKWYPITRETYLDRLSIRYTELNFT